jgi:hypothetical protein
MAAIMRATMQGCEIVCPSSIRQRRVLARKLAERVGHEGLARHHLHGVQEPFVAHAACGDLMLHHVLAQGAHVRHKSRRAARLVAPLD